MNKKRVYLNEYNTIIGNTTYLPFVSGLLHAHASTSNAITSDYEFMPYNFHINQANKVIDAHVKPSVAAFSVCMWNEQLSLKVAEGIKKRYPNCFVVFGGPQVPHYPYKYLSQYSFIDATVRGEGEETFKEILERMILTQELDDISGVTWRTPSGEIRRTEKIRPFNRDLDVYPSPYLTGLYESLIATHSKINFQAIIETNRGCPFHCTFCFWGMGGLSRKYRYHSLERIKAELEWMASHRIRYVFNADSNFGINKRDEDIARMLVEIKDRHGYPEKFRTCYGKNTDERILNIGKIFHQHQLEKGITISYQSMNINVQKNIKRSNINLNLASKLHREFNRYRIPVYTELILGLPGETVESWIAGIEQVLKMGLKSQVFLYICEVLPNTDLANPEYQAHFCIETKRIELTEIHGSPRKNSWIKEYEDIVIATYSLTTVDWQRMLKFSWCTMLLHGLKVGFFVMLYVNKNFGISYQEMILRVSEGFFDSRHFPILSRLQITMNEKIKRILGGEGRGCLDAAWGDLYWEQEEILFFKISENWDEFYLELSAVIDQLLKNKNFDWDSRRLSEVFCYQRLRMPEINARRKNKKFDWNALEYFDGLLIEDEIEITNSPQTIQFSPLEFGSEPLSFAMEILRRRKNGNFLAHVSRISHE